MNEPALNWLVTVASASSLTNVSGNVDTNSAKSLPSMEMCASAFAANRGRLSELTFFGRAIDSRKSDRFSNAQIREGPAIAPVLKALEQRLGP